MHRRADGLASSFTSRDEEDKLAAPAFCWITRTAARGQAASSEDVPPFSTLDNQLLSAKRLT